MILLPQRRIAQPPFRAALDERHGTGNYVVRALVNPASREGHLPRDPYGAWTITGTPNMRAVGPLAGLQWGTGNYASRALTLTGDSSGTQTHRSFVELAVFTVLSNAAQECIVSEGNTYNDGGPRFLLQNNSGTLRTYQNGAYTDSEAAIIGRRYVFVRTYRELASASYPFKAYLNGRLYATSTGYQSAVASTFIGAGFPGYSNNNILHAYYFERGSNVWWTDSAVAELSRNPWALFQPTRQRLFVVVGSSSITGTAAATDVRDTSAATGTLTVTGTVGATDRRDTSSAAGTVTVTGAIAATDVRDTSTGTGTVGSGAVSGTIAVSDRRDTSSASGILTVTGSVASSDRRDTASASGTNGAVATPPAVTFTPGARGRFTPGERTTFQPRIQ